IHDLIMETQKNIDPNKYPTIDDAQKAADKFKDKWLKTAQNELEHKTPMDVILEERAALGNSDKEFNIQVEISRVPDFDLNEAEKLYHEGAKAFKNGSIIKAVELFGEVTNMYPESYKAWGNLGRCYASLGNKKEAIRCYKRALSIEPNYEFAKKNLIAIKDLDVSK
ncbi:MAG: tetratricopeptide repeat protein, partial [Candidatus Thermoplasmatota archaeon]